MKKPRIRVWGKAPLTKLGKLAGVGLKRLRWLRKWRLKNQVSFTERLDNLMGANFTITAKQRGTDTINIEILKSSSFNRLVTARTGQAVFLRSASSITDTVVNVSLGEVEGEAVEAQLLTPLASTMSFEIERNDALASPTYHQQGYLLTEELAPKVLAKNYGGDAALNLIHRNGALAIRRVDMPAEFAALLDVGTPLVPYLPSENLSILSAESIVQTHSEYTSYHLVDALMVPSEEMAFNRGDRPAVTGYGPLITVTVPNSEMPYNRDTYDTIELVNFPKGGNITLNPVSDLIFNVATPVDDFQSGNYFEDDGTRTIELDDRQEYSLFATVADLINGVDNGDGTITATARYVTEAFFNNYGYSGRVWFPQEFYVQDLRKLVRPAAPDKVWAGAATYSAPVFMGSYLEFGGRYNQVGTVVDDLYIEYNRACSVQRDLKYGLYVGYSDTKYTRTDEFVRREDTGAPVGFPFDDYSVGDLYQESRELDVLYYFAHRFSFDIASKTFFVGDELSTQDLNEVSYSQTINRSRASPTPLVDENSSTTWSGTSLTQLAIDNDLRTVGSASLSWSQTVDTLGSTIETGGWTVSIPFPSSTQDSEEDAFIMPTSEGTFYTELVSGSNYNIYLGTTLLTGPDILAGTGIRNGWFPNVFYDYRAISKKSVAIKRALEIRNISGDSGVWLTWGDTASGSNYRQTETTLFGHSSFVISGSFPGIPTNRDADQSPATTTDIPEIPRPLNGIPVNIDSYAVFAPQLSGGRDGIMHAQKTLDYDAAYLAYITDPTPANKAALEAEYTIKVNNFASRTFIEAILGQTSGDNSSILFA